MHDFLDYLRKNKASIEPVIYTSGVPEYTNMMLDLIDPQREIF